MQWLENMIDPLVIQALGRMILHSLWQASLIALCLYLILQHIPEKKAALRHELSAFALFMVFVVALCTFLLELQAETGTVLIKEILIGDINPVVYKDPASSMNALYYSVYIWLTGLIILSIRLIAGYCNLFRLKSQNTRIQGWPQETLLRLKAKLRIRSRIRLVESALVNLPATIGYLKPVILIPVSTMMQLSPGQLEAVIAHELAHIKRADYLLNLFYSIIEVTFYFHPAVWWISSQMRHEREASCDDLAIQITGNKAGYLKTLLELKTHTSTPPLVMGIFGNNQSFYRRFNRQLITPHHNSKTMEKITIVALLLLSFIGFAFRSQEKVIQIDTTKAIVMKENIIVSDFQDTIPKNKSKHTVRIKTDLDGHRYEILKENGNIVYLKEDGKKIDEAQFDKYQSVLNKLNHMLDTPPPAPPIPPMPPSPAVPDVAPFAPSAPSPPSPPTPRSRMPEAPPAPPAPPAPEVYMPIAPPMPPEPPQKNEQEYLEMEEMMARQQEEMRYQMEAMSVQLEMDRELEMAGLIQEEMHLAHQMALEIFEQQERSQEEIKAIQQMQKAHLDEMRESLDAQELQELRIFEEHLNTSKHLQEIEEEINNGHLYLPRNE